MRWLFIIVPLFMLLAFALWFAGRAWITLGGEDLPPYAYIAIGGGILFSLIIGCGLMALMFYSSRHGFDEAADTRHEETSHK